MDIKKYASNLKGVAMFALDSWDQQNRQKGGDAYLRMHRAGLASAYSQVLWVITSRDVGTEMELVKEIIDQIS